MSAPDPPDGAAAHSSSHGPDSPTAVGLDLGTSGVKAVLVATDGSFLAEASVPLTVSRPQVGWSEQAPADWLQAVDAAMRALRRDAEATQWARVRALAVAGQMHGAVTIDATGQVLRPAILWNDARSHAECAELEALEPASRAITANRALPGFTAPKLMWLRRHEPDLHARIAKVLLPKDWITWTLTGNFSTDVSDAAGTLWLDVTRRSWSAPMLAATGMRPEQLPDVHESTQCVGSLKPEWARAWGLPVGVRIAAGAGDNAAGAIGMGVVATGDALLSIGTSGVIFAVADGPRADPERAIHTFCHALPDTWHQMSVTLSASSALGWWSTIAGAAPADLLASLQPAQVREGAPLFVPYLSGERTPHADAQACGTFHDLVHAHTRDDLAYAVIEGVAFAFADGLQALNAAGTRPPQLLAIGGAARSDIWLQLIADTLGLPLDRPAGADVGPAAGAARLALASLGPRFADVIGRRPAIERRFDPIAGNGLALRRRRERSGWIYQALRGLR